MISISSLNFDASGWELLELKFDEILWRDEVNETLIALHYFSKKPDIPCSLNQIDQLRYLYRQAIAGSGGGIISMEIFKVKELDCLELICKVPQEPHGMCYFASLTFPFADFSYVIKLECPELGMTGLREAMVFAEMQNSGLLQINTETGRVEGWMEDPYDPNFEGPISRNLAEHEKYDEQFPDHPLSRARRLLSRIKDSLVPSEGLRAARRFIG